MEYLGLIRTYHGPGDLREGNSLPPQLDCGVTSVRMWGVTLLLWLRALRAGFGLLSPVTWD